jgi:hypothetical protein
LPNRGIGHEFAAPHVAHCLGHGGRLVGTILTYGGTEKITRGKVADVQTLFQEFGLCALSDSWRTK